jgi:hypothetical protein
VTQLPQKRKIRGPQKAPTGSHNQLEAKPSPILQIVKQLTTGRMGRMTVAQHPRSPTPEVTVWLQAPLLGGKSHWLAHTGNWSSTLPLIQDATFTLKHQGNQYPCVSRSHGSYCFMGNRRCKTAGLVSLTTVPQN